ncbi:hypothetical protein FO519_005707 [Halicephalobus sp. NKZ332]|nr:hypothetical protein FO519_005707 [Halicephalobus sp. NKZ332]
MNFWFIARGLIPALIFLALIFLYLAINNSGDYENYTNLVTEYSVLNPDAASTILGLRLCLDKIYSNFFDSNDYIDKFTACVKRAFSNLKFDEFKMGRFDEIKKFFPLNPQFDQSQCIWLTIGIGGDTQVEKEFKEKYPRCSVYGIEASPDQYADFKKYGTIIPYGVAAETGSFSLTVREGVQYNKKDIKVLSMVDVLDRFIGQRIVHYMTIDIEGFEYSILEQLLEGKLLSRQGIVFCQIDAELHDSRADKPDPIEEFLNKYNSPTSHYIPIFTSKFLKHQKVMEEGRILGDLKSRIPPVETKPQTVEDVNFSRMKCKICIQYTRCRRYGGLVCAACADFQILKCQSCRFKKCFQVGMKADRVKASSPKSSDDESDTVTAPIEFVIFAQALENLVEACTDDSEGTLRYLKEETSEVLQKALARFTQTYNVTDLSRRTRSWSLILYRSNVKREELPLLFQLTVIHFSYIYYNFFDGSIRQKLGTIIKSGFRFQELESICKEIISTLDM